MCVILIGYDFVYSTGYRESRVDHSGLDGYTH